MIISLAAKAEVYSLVMTNNVNLEVDYYEAKERLEGLRQAEEIKKDTDMYYLLGQSLVGKRVTGSEANDFLFIDSTWTFDDEGIIEKKLSGTDLTKLKFESWPPSSIELINEIRSIDRDEAMERITDQTLLGLKRMWKEKFAKAKEKWDKDPKWYAKLVRTDIIMNGVERSITPGDLPFEAGPSIDGFMESIRSEMNEDLRDEGAFIVGIWGMID